MEPSFANFASTAGTRADVLDLLRRLTQAGLADVLAMRAMAEPQAAAVAVSSASGADIQAIFEAHSRASAETELEAFEAWDTEFHRLIFASTRNELLISLHDILKLSRNRAPWIALKRKAFNEAQRQDYCAQHGAIADCLARRDAPGAAAAMRAHIDAVSRTLLHVT